MILLIGANGSMGKRYQAILNYLNKPFIAVDLETSFETVLNIALECNRIIIATPTDTHVKFLRELIPLNKKILCEKPVCKNSAELEEILDLVKNSKSTFEMVFQYGELVNTKKTHKGDTFYDYFKTGNDGLKWDCLQIIAIAKGQVKINNKSPIWTCKLNGTVLSSSAMDQAYIDFLDRWLNNKISRSHQWLLDIHKKAENYVQ